MNLPRFNEPELFLLKNWEDLLQVERSMRAIRDKYPAILDAVLDKVEQKYKGLTYRAIPREKWEAVVGIGKPSWPRSSPTWPSGFWLGFIGLHHFSPEEKNPPDARVLFHAPKGFTIGLDAATETLHTAVKRLLTKEQHHRIRKTVKKEWISIRYPLELSREKLWELISNNQVQELVDILAAQFDPLVELVPIIDDLLAPAESIIGSLGPNEVLYKGDQGQSAPCLETQQRQGGAE